MNTDAMKSNLLRKDREWYSQFGWDVPDDLKYVYGVEAEDGRSR